jgi:hypothetical protein
MRLHIDALAILHLVWGGLGVLTGAAVAILAAGTHAALYLGGSLGRTELASVWFLAIMAALLMAGGAAQIAAGLGLGRRRASGRTAALVLAVPNLLLLPLGTALGMYAFWVLLNNDARREFGIPVSGDAAKP